MSSSPCFLDPVIIPAVRGATVLDVACGYGRWGCLLHSNYWETSGGAVLEVDGFDAFPQNVALCQQKGVYRRVFQHQLPAPLAGAWDTVLACEILEHLEGDDVAPVLDLLERLATLRVICTAPNWPYFREGGQTRVGYNPFEAHKTFIPREFFLDRGYRVFGAGFGNPTHPVVRALQLSDPQGAWTGAREVLPRLVPELAHTLVAIKDLDAPKETSRA